MGYIMFRAIFDINIVATFLLKLKDKLQLTISGQIEGSKLRNTISKAIFHHSGMK